MLFMNRKFHWMVAGMLALSAPIAGASVLTYTASLSGAAEAPPNGSAGTGSATLLIDLVANTMTLDVVFSGLTGNTSASHIHCCTALPGTSTAGVATQTPTFSGFPLGVTSGSYNQTFDLGLASTWNPAFVTANAASVAAAEAAFLTGLHDGKAYLNIHTNIVPSGEIRGFLREVPEPGVLSLLGLSLGGIAAVGARRRNQPA